MNIVVLKLWGRRGGGDDDIDDNDDDSNNDSNDNNHDHNYDECEINTIMILIVVNLHQMLQHVKSGGKLRKNEDLDGAALARLHRHSSV
jgi:hypothetical protein